MFYYLVVSSNLVNFFNAQLVVEELWLSGGGSYCLWWWVWQDCQSFAHMPTPPTFSILLPHALFPGQFTLSPRFCFWILLTHRFWGVFGSHAGFLPLPHELLSTHELQIRVLPVVCASTDKNGAVFPHAGPPLSVPFLAGSDCLTTHRYSSVWGAHGELRAVLLHPRLTVKGHSRFLAVSQINWVVFSLL